MPGAIVSNRASKAGAVLRVGIIRSSSTCPFVGSVVLEKCSQFILRNKAYWQLPLGVCLYRVLK